MCLMSAQVCSESLLEGGPPRALQIQNFLGGQTHLRTPPPPRDAYISEAHARCMVPPRGCHLTPQEITSWIRPWIKGLCYCVCMNYLSQEPARGAYSIFWTVLAYPDSTKTSDRPRIRASRATAISAGYPTLDLPRYIATRGAPPFDCIICDLHLTCLRFERSFKYHKNTVNINIFTYIISSNVSITMAVMYLT